MPDFTDKPFEEHNLGRIGGIPSAPSAPVPSGGYPESAHAGLNAQVPGVAQPVPQALLSAFENHDHRDFARRWEAEMALAVMVDSAFKKEHANLYYPQGAHNSLDDEIHSARERYVALIATTATKVLQALPGVQVEGKFDVGKEKGRETPLGAVVARFPADPDGGIPDPHAWGLMAAYHRSDPPSRRIDIISLSVWNEATGTNKEWDDWTGEDSPASIALDFSQRVQALPDLMRERLADSEAEREDANPSEGTV